MIKSRASLPVLALLVSACHLRSNATAQSEKKPITGPVSHKTLFREASVPLAPLFALNDLSPQEIVNRLEELHGIYVLSKDEKVRSRYNDDKDYALNFDYYEKLNKPALTQVAAYVAPFAQSKSSQGPSSLPGDRPLIEKSILYLKTATMGDALNRERLIHEFIHHLIRVSSQNQEVDAQNGQKVAWKSQRLNDLSQASQVFTDLGTRFLALEKEGPAQEVLDAKLRLLHAVNDFFVKAIPTLDLVEGEEIDVCTLVHLYRRELGLADLEDLNLEYFRDNIDAYESRKDTYLGNHKWAAEKFKNDGKLPSKELAAFEAASVRLSVELPKKILAAKEQVKRSSD